MKSGNAAFAKSTPGQPAPLTVLQDVIAGNLCHRCGSCVGICPTSVLGFSEEFFPEVQNAAACTKCGRCEKVCPGKAFDAPQIAQDLFGKPFDPSDFLGHFESAQLSFAVDPVLRRESSSGGFITALLTHLLSTKQIDAALIVRQHAAVVWRAEAHLVNSVAELRTTGRSKYILAPTNQLWREIKRLPGKVAVVALPCEIHGFRKAAALDPLLREKVLLTIGLFCHATLEPEPYEEMWRKLGDRRNAVKKFYFRFGKHPGQPTLEFADGSRQPAFFPFAPRNGITIIELVNVLFRLYTPPRCLTCFDATAEFADLAVGDPWMEAPSGIDFFQGYSCVLVRTRAGQERLQNAVQAGVLKTLSLTPTEARTCNSAMGNAKRWRAYHLIRSRSKRGQPVPDYGFSPPVPVGRQRRTVLKDLFTHALCFIPLPKRLILRGLLTPAGYALFWLNHQRRRLLKRK